MSWICGLGPGICLGEILCPYALNGTSFPPSSRSPTMRAVPVTVSLSSCMGGSPPLVTLLNSDSFCRHALPLGDTALSPFSCFHHHGVWCMSVGAHSPTTHTWQSKGNSLDLVLCFHLYLDSGEQTWVVRLTQ